MAGLTRCAGVWLLILSATSAAQSAQDHIKKAQALVAKGQFGPALKWVDKAVAEQGNDLETTLELLELSGICNAGVKKVAPAKLAFQKLLSLEPTHSLSKKVPPAVAKVFADAKSKVEAAEILPAVPDRTGGRISGIAVEVNADPYKLAKTILFNYRLGTGKWKTRAVPVAPGRIATKVDGVDRIEWYATVLGANDAEVMRIRTADAPITHTSSAPSVAVAPVPTATPPVPARPPPPPPPATRPPAPVPVDDTPRRDEGMTVQLTPIVQPTQVQVADSRNLRRTWVAPLSVTLIAAGGATAGGLGTFFALQSTGARRSFNEATATSGIVRAITRQKALDLDSQSRSNAVIANTLWIAGGTLVLTGIVIALLVPDKAAP